jgi:UMF1 family MFS transporter
MLNTLREPMRGVDDRKSAWSWISFDVANQSFTLIVNTLLFSKYFMEVVLPSGTADPNTKWSIVFTISMLMTVLASPVAGAVADDRGRKKTALLITGFGCAMLTCALGFVPATYVWIIIALYIPANFCFNLGENFLASFLPELAPREDFGRLSGFSWACAYFAALILLVITVVAMFVFELQAVESWRPFFIFAGLWFLVFSIPTAIWLRERRIDHATPGNPLVVGFSRLADTLREARKHRDLALLLIASFFYGIAMQVVIAFASKIATDYGFTAQGMVIFVAVITVSGIVGTLATAAWQDRLGHKRTTLALLAVWLVVCICFALYTHAHLNNPDPLNFPKWPLWALGNLIGFGLGSLGAANRAFVGFLTPTSRSAEFFGLWGLVFKLAAIGTIPFAAARDRFGDPVSFSMLAAFVIIGAIVTLFVREHAPSDTAVNEESI